MQRTSTRQSNRLRVRPTEETRYVCSMHDGVYKASENPGRASSRLRSPSACFSTSHEAQPPLVFEDEGTGENIDWVLAEPNTPQLPSVPTRRKAGRQPVFADDVYTSNVRENADRASTRSRRSLAVNRTGLQISRARMGTAGRQDDGDSWEVTPPTRNMISFARFLFYVGAITDMLPRPAPVVVWSTTWHLWLTKASIVLTVLSAAAMVGEDLVQIFAIITLFLGFLFTMGSI